MQLRRTSYLSGCNSQHSPHQCNLVSAKAIRQGSVLGSPVRLQGWDRRSHKNKQYVWVNDAKQTWQIPRQTNSLTLPNNTYLFSYQFWDMRPRTTNTHNMWALAKKNKDETRPYLPLKLVLIYNAFPTISKQKYYNWYTYSRFSWSSEDGLRWR
jgi:hypothetical protein